MDEPAAVAAHLGRNLSTLRRTRGLTQGALAKAAALPRSTIANLESGEGNPSLTVLVKVSDALGVPVDELLASARAQVRHWRAAEVAERRMGHGLKVRPLIPEPAPDETMTIMSFEPGGALKGTPIYPGRASISPASTAACRSASPASASIWHPATFWGFREICRTPIRTSIASRPRAASRW
ncbi:MAG TPA: helix-turn-helix transcriptional regulator [Stellaceae bacterium]|nr:helix-turn-helix transcriptional regulator [Stellaceae bacterium]